jgi:hypothetical protein
MVLIDVPDDLLDAIHKNKIVKIKLEADFDPPPHFTTELMRSVGNNGHESYLVSPTPRSIQWSV